MRERKLVIVSNRLPVSVSKDSGKLVIAPSSGGLATAMSSLNTKPNTIWVGWPGISADKLTPAEKATITRKLKTYGCRPVFLTDEQIKKFYAGYSNSTLWPLFHYFQHLIAYRDEYWQAYWEVNSLFKKAVTAEADEKTSIWVHDYQLMLLPAMLRKALPRSAIGYFLHIPFPSYEIFRLLPKRKEILKGVLGADLVGFHIYDYARHFLSSVSRILGLESRQNLVEYRNRLIKVDTFPIGIDNDKFRAVLDQPETKKQIDLLAKTYAGQKIILSIDRLDYSKGILQRLTAFELLFKEHPALAKCVSLIMITVPSRTNVQTYKDLKRAIDQTIGRINGKYATAGWTPITYHFKNLAIEQIVALYDQADVALVTPLRDGMNLVAKEYVATKLNRDGVLILSEMAGAIDELQEALHVNPNDVRSIMSALLKALNMSNKERSWRLEAMQQRLSAYDIHRWSDDFIEQLDEIKKIQAEESGKLLDAKSSRPIVRAFKDSAKRLIILDYDGTIQKFFKSPEPAFAKPSKALRKLIEKMALQPSVQLCIVSGRTREALDSWFGDLPIKLVAEHGAWIKSDDKWLQTKSSFAKYKKVLLPILEQYARRTVGSNIEEKDYALVWHFRNVPTELAYVRNTSLKKELDRLLADSKIGAYTGQKIIEIKPRNINKGNAVRKLLAANRSNFILCIGDDYTDEDMFKILPKSAFTIKVGLGKTNARFRLPDIDETLNLLKKIASS